MPRAFNHFTFLAKIIKLISFCLVWSLFLVSVSASLSNILAQLLKHSSSEMRRQKWFFMWIYVKTFTQSSVYQLSFIYARSYNLSKSFLLVPFSSFCNDLILGHHWALSITITHEAWLGPDGCNCPLCNVHNDSRAISDRRLSDSGGWCREGRPKIQTRVRRPGLGVRQRILRALSRKPGPENNIGVWIDLSLRRILQTTDN